MGDEQLPGVCHLAAVPANVLAVNQNVNALRAVTGWETVWELLKVDERSTALARAFNCREGFTPKDDTLPKRLHQAFTEGLLKDVRIEPDKFARALRLYHQMEGWEPEAGRAIFTKLAELGIEWAAKPGDAW